MSNLVRITRCALLSCVFLLATSVSAEAVDLCTETFSLIVRIHSPVATSSETSGLDVSTKSGQTTVSRVGSNQKAVSLSPKICANWQKQIFPYLDRSLSKHKSPARKKLECLNVANIKVGYRGSYKNEQVCLTKASEDSVTRDFKLFYEGTEGML